ncbi:MAG: hypothetical protein QOE45_1997 [Frankiaceae bacterium]|jgi:hypothetical protein|nr:hypothetical protein [Frankiaceae bacterium]
MPGRRRRLLIVTSAVALAAALVTMRALASASPPRLGPADYDDTNGVTVPVANVQTFFAGGFEPHGSDPVHVRSVHLTGVPRGIRVVGVYGLEGGPPGGSQSAPDAGLRARFRPVTDMVFHAGKPREEWVLVILLEGTEPGTWVTTGIDVAWRAGRHRGTSHYKHRFELDVTA